MKEVKIGGIYRHFKGNYYFIKDVAYHCERNDWSIIIYHRCDINGIFERVYDEIMLNDITRGIQSHDSNHTIEESKELCDIVKQPFYRSIKDFLSPTLENVPRFQFIKMRRDYENN